MEAMLEATVDHSAASMQRCWYEWSKIDVLRDCCLLEKDGELSVDREG